MLASPTDRMAKRSQVWSTAPFGMARSGIPAYLERPRKSRGGESNHSPSQRNSHRHTPRHVGPARRSAGVLRKMLGRFVNRVLTLRSVLSHLHKPSPRRDQHAGKRKGTNVAVACHDWRNGAVVVLSSEAVQQSSVGSLDEAEHRQRRAGHLATRRSESESMLLDAAQASSSITANSRPSNSRSGGWTATIM